MPRINFALSFRNSSFNPPSSNDGLITLTLYANGTWVGPPKCRIYIEGSAPPAYTDMTLAGSVHIFSGINLVPETYIVELETGISERVSTRIGKVNIRAKDDTCFTSSGETRISGIYQVYDWKISIRTIIQHLSSDSSDKAHKLSIDEGATYKDAVLTDSTSTLKTYTTEWTDSELVALGIGTEIPSIVIKRDACESELATDLRYDPYAIVPLNVEYVANSPTAVGGNNGSITLTVTGGSGNYSFLWADGPTTQNRTGLVAGTYTVTLTDNDTEEEIVLDIIVTDPQPPNYNGNFLYFPVLNGLRMVVREEIDNCTTLPTPDNQLFVESRVPGYPKQWYSEKVCKCDTIPIQFNSNYGSHIVSLKEWCSEETVKTFTVTLKEQLQGVVQQFFLTLKEDLDDSSKTRVYFNVGTPPIPLEDGNVFTILNNLEGMNGTYTILSIVTDESLGYQYLLIDLEYSGSSEASSAEGRFTTSIENFNVYEFTGEFLDVPSGNYFIEVYAFDSTENFKVAMSEPIDLQLDHPKTNMIEARNSFNKYDVSWTTGFIVRMRVPSVLFKFRPGGENFTSRNSDYSMVKTNSQRIRGYIFETVLLPPYLHERLSLVFALDYVAINKIEMQTDQNYNEPQYIHRVRLASSSIAVEQKNWFRTVGNNGIGTVEEYGFLSTETGFIKV